MSTRKRFQDRVDGPGFRQRSSSSSRSCSPWADAATTTSTSTPPRPGIPGWCVVDHGRRCGLRPLDPQQGTRPRRIPGVVGWRRGRGIRGDSRASSRSRTASTTTTAPRPPRTTSSSMADILGFDFNGTYNSYAVSAFDHRTSNESELSWEYVVDVPRPEGYDLRLEPRGCVPPVLRLRPELPEQPGAAVGEHVNPRELDRAGLARIRFGVWRVVAPRAHETPAIGQRLDQSERGHIVGAVTLVRDRHSDLAARGVLPRRYRARKRNAIDVGLREGWRPTQTQQHKHSYPPAAYGLHANTPVPYDVCRSPYLPYSLAGAVLRHKAAIPPPLWDATPVCRDPS